MHEATPNNTKNFLPLKAHSDWRQEEFLFPASVAMEAGSAVGIQITSNATTGYKTLMGVENANGADFVGILAEPILTTDPDYATAGKVRSVFVPITPAAEARFRVGSGSFTPARVGSTVEFHATATSLAVGTLGKGARITKYIDEDTGVCRFDMPTTETA